MAKLELPKGTPREFPPFPGATKNWSPKSLEVVKAIRDKAPGIICATYAGHGRTGEAWGIDSMVSPFNQMPTAAQAKFGGDLMEWLANNWSRFDINYAIWWNQMNDGAGWFNYEPLRLDWIRRTNGGSPNLVTSRHLDHVHIQISSPWLPGDE